MITAFFNGFLGISLQFLKLVLPVQLYHLLYVFLSLSARAQTLHSLVSHSVLEGGIALSTILNGLVSYDSQVNFHISRLQATIEDRLEDLVLLNGGVPLIMA